MIVRPLITIAVFVVSNAQDPNDFNFGKEPKFCPPFQCTGGLQPVPNWPMRLTSSGCNSMGGMMVMDKHRTDEPLGSCCDRWNACYQICGSLKDNCDEQFKKCTKESCEAKSDPEEKESCDRSANIQTMMLQFTDCRKFDEGQRLGCSCVDKSKIAGSRERVIRNFYKKFNPEGVGKVESLAKKADNRVKVANLFQKLVAKYPDAIKKIKDPQQEMMDRIMKEAQEKKESENSEIVEDGEDDADDSDSEKIEL